MRNCPRVTPTILRLCFLDTYQHLASGSRPRYLVNLQLPALDYSICETNIGFVDLRRCITRNTRLWRASGIPYSPPSGGTSSLTFLFDISTILWIW